MPEQDLHPAQQEARTRSIVPEGKRGPIVSGVRNRHVRRSGSRRQLLLSFFVLVVIGGVVAAGYFWFLPSDETYRLTEYDSAPVTVRTLQDTVELSGVVEARRLATVGAPEQGVIDLLYVDEGDWVTAGQLVARLDAESVQDDLDARQRSLESQTRDYERFLLEHEYTLKSFDRKRATLEKQIADAEEELADVEELFDLGSASGSELDDAREAVDDARDVLLDHDLEVEESLAIHELNKQNYEDDLSTTREEIIDLQERIAETRIPAPITGRVISISDAATTEGELLNQYATIMEIADSRNPIVQTEIEEQYVEYLSVGQPVAVEISGSRVQAAVERIGLIAQTSSDGGTPTVELDIALDVGNSEVLPGSSALVEVLIGETPDALVLPRGPYLTSGNRRYLYRIDGQTATRIPVEYGAITDDYVQVASGVQEGDRIVTSSYQSYIDHTSIQIGEDR